MVLQPDHPVPFKLAERRCWEKWADGVISPHALPVLFSTEGLNQWTPAASSWYPMVFFTHQIFIEGPLLSAKPRVQVERSLCVYNI